MAESKGWAQALRRVTRGGADWTSSPGKGFSNMRDWAATMRTNLTQRAQRREEKSERVVGKFCSGWGAAVLRPYRDITFWRRWIWLRRQRISFGSARRGRQCLLAFACR